MAELRIDTNEKRTIANGWGDTKEQKKMLTKELVKTLIHSGIGSTGKNTNIAKICSVANISRKTLYNYMEEDKQFERQVRSGMLVDLQVQAAMNVMDTIKKGDYIASQKYLKDTGYYNKYTNQEKSDIPELTENEDGSFSLPNSIEDIAGDIMLSLDGEYVDTDNGDTGDKLAEALRLKDIEAEKKMAEIRQQSNV